MTGIASSEKPSAELGVTKVWTIDPTVRTDGPCDARSAVVLHGAVKVSVPIRFSAMRIVTWICVEMKWS